MPHLPVLHSAVLIATVVALAPGCVAERGRPAAFVCVHDAEGVVTGHDGALLVAGSGAAMPLAELALATTATSDMRLGPSIGSGGAVAALTQGDIDIGLLGRPLRANEAAKLRFFHVAASEVVLATSHRAAGASWTVAEAAALLDGTAPRWPNGASVQRFTREAGDTGVEALAAHLPSLAAALIGARTRRLATVAFTDTEMVVALRETPDAIGVSDRGLLRATATALRTPVLIDGGRADRPMRVVGVAVRRDAPPALQGRALALAATMRAEAARVGGYVVD